MTRSFCIHVCSGDSKNIRSGNTASSFHVDLPYPIHFNGRWSCEVEAAYCFPEKTRKTILCMHILVDFIKPTIAYGTQLRILSTFPYKESNSGTVTYLKPVECHPAVIDTHLIQTFHVEIVTNKLELCDFLEGDTVLSLRFSEIH